MSIRDSSYPRKWFLLGTAIGVIASLGAGVFDSRCDTPGNFCSAAWHAATAPRQSVRVATTALLASNTHERSRSDHS